MAKNKNRNQVESKNQNSFDDLTRYQAKNKQNNNQNSNQNNNQNSNQNNRNSNKKNEQSFR